MTEPHKAAGRVASVMQESRVFPPPAAFSSRARIGSLEEDEDSPVNGTSASVARRMSGS